MSTIPPEIARFRQKGTEIKCIRGHYYLQRVTSRWDKQARKVRKITLGYLGRVTPEGVIPRKTRRIPADAKPYSKRSKPTSPKTPSGSTPPH